MKIEFEKWFLSFHGPPPHFWPASRSRPNDPPRAAPLPRPSPPCALASFFPRARTRPTASGTPRRVASACRRRRPSGVPWPPQASAPRHFQATAAPLLPALLIFLSRAASLSRPAPSSAHAAIATVAPPAKLAAGAPPLPSIEHTSLCLAPRHLVLTAGTPFEQGIAVLRVSPPSVMAPPRLTPPWKASPVPSSSLCVACSGSPPSCGPCVHARLPGHGRQRPSARWQRPHRLERRRGVASRLGRAGPGRHWAEAPSQAAALPLRSVVQAKSGRGPVVPTGRPSSNRKNGFRFSFIIWEEKYFGK